MKEQPSKDAFRKLQVLDLSQKPEDLSEEDYDDFFQEFDEEIKMHIPSTIPTYLKAGLNVIIKVRWLDLFTKTACVLTFFFKKNSQHVKKHMKNSVMVSMECLMI